MKKNTSYIGRWWHRLPDGRLQCDLCPRACALKPGQRGFCYARQAAAEGIALTAYGRATGFYADPIEKKPLNHFYPGASVLSFGTAGCNLGCRFCQNWDMSKARDDDRMLEAAQPEEIARAARAAGCMGVAFTYNDPVIFAEYAIDAARACHEAGLFAVAVTAGYISPPAREEFFSVMDAANVDLKAFTDHFYQKLAFARLQPVLDTLEYIARETSVWLEITTLMIPGWNDDPKEIDAMTRWIVQKLGADVPMHFTAFHPAYKMQDVPRTPPETLTRAREIAFKNGIRHVYTGNVVDPAGASTYCPHCGKMVIRRDGYMIGSYDIKEGACGFCGGAIAGYFGACPGDWGGGRETVKAVK